MHFEFNGFLLGGIETHFKIIDSIFEFEVNYNNACNSCVVMPSFFSPELYTVLPRNHTGSSPSYLVMYL